MSTYLSEPIAVAISVGLLTLYQLYLSLKLRRDPTYTVYAENRRARAEWVSYIAKDRSNGLLAVHTLRNSTMAGTFFASTAVLLMIGTLNLALQSETLGELVHVDLVDEAGHRTIWLLKIMLLTAAFFMAFLSFAIAVRLFNHVGYLITVTTADPDAPISVRKVSAYMSRAGTYYTIGMRSYYLSVPLVFWLFGPSYLVASTLLLLFALYQIDRAP